MPTRRRSYPIGRSSTSTPRPTSHPMKPLFLLTSLIALPGSLLAQATPTAKQAPPPGIEVPEADATALKSGIAAIDKELTPLRTKSGPLLALIPDVEVFRK